MFDVPHQEVFYDLAFGNNLLKVYTLNTGIPSAGEQRVWLAKNLESSQKYIWRFAQYHTSMRPHSKAKPEKNNLILDWATLFHKYRVQLAIESDAHVVKWTYPIRPSRGPNSAEGFERDNVNGTVYIGEGCWGAPLRTNDDNKPWTRDSDMFNQFKWIFVDRASIEVRTLRIDEVNSVQEISHFNPFEMPPGIDRALWKPKNGSVLVIKNPDYRAPVTFDRNTTAQNTPPKPPANKVPLIKPDPITGNISLSYQLRNPGDVFIVLMNNQKQEINRYKLAGQNPGPHKQSVNFAKISPGKYFIQVISQQKIVAVYQVDNLR